MILRSVLSTVINLAREYIYRGAIIDFRAIVDEIAVLALSWYGLGTGQVGLGTNDERIWLPHHV